MALLEDCFCCSLSMAAFVVGVYTLVAYIFAFFMQAVCIVTTPVAMPSPAYILCVGYLIVSFVSVILLKGLPTKNTLFLLEWLVVVAALAVPEGVLVYFMSVHYWKLRTWYGLMELTWWVCRAIVSISGIVCVQSLYSTWQEEKEIRLRLLALNLIQTSRSRRNSLTSVHGHVNGSPLPQPVPLQLLNNGTFAPTTNPQRSASTMTVWSRSHSPDPNLPMSLPDFPSEFNASQFDQSLSLQTAGPKISKSYSLEDLRNCKSDSMSDTPRKTMSVENFAIGKPQRQTQTQSLDRRILRSSGYWMNHSPDPNGLYRYGRLIRAYYPPFGNDLSLVQSQEFVQSGQLIYGRNMNSFYPRKADYRSKQSVGSDSDDYKKYRDIAL